MLQLSAYILLTILFLYYRDCPGLLTIELQENLLENVEGPFLISRSLQYLDISSCKLTSLNPEFFINLTALHTLDLSRNPLGTLGPEAFDPLTSLETLVLNNCELTAILDPAFSSLDVLKRLELAGNKLTEIDWPLVLGNLLRLEYLDVRNSKITYIPEDSFTNTTWLRTLILAENELTDLDVSVTLDNLPHLDMLDLSNCHLQGLISDDAFINSTKLKTLHLSGNYLKVTDLQIALEPLLSLEKLFLRNCSLKTLPDTFNKLMQLEELDISHNPLEDAFTNLLAPLEKLEYLNMGYSNLSYIGPETFSKMTSMRRLVLSGNDLNSLEAGLFGNLTLLESLELSDCGLRRPINATVFFTNLTYTELKELKLAGNPLIIMKDSPLFPKQLSRLKSLDLSKCNLTFLPDNAFKLNENITQLNLAGNQLDSQPGSLKFLQLLPSLENLDLGNNNMTSISPQIFFKNPKINSLRLVGNPWKCDCNIAEMWDWAAMVKGDLSVLVGSKTSPDDFTLKGAKRKKSLLCYYEETQMREFPNVNRTVAGRRPFVKPHRELTSANRTWAKYVRESGCEPVVRILKPMPLVMSEGLDEVTPVGNPPLRVVMFSISLILLGLTAVLIITFRIRRRHRTRQSNQSLPKK